MIITLIRTLILFALVVVALRLMGKRQIGKLQPYELVIIVMIADLAAVPMEDIGIPLLSGIIPILTLLFVEVAISFGALKSERLRGVVCGTPSILVANGKIVEAELRRLRYNINDLLEQLRTKNFPNIADVEYAILETSGEISVVPKSQKRPVIPADLNIPTKYEGIPMTLIIDGYVFEQNLKKINLSREWLQTELQKFGIGDLKQVLLASLDTEGNLFYQVKTRTA
ncbi:YetF domain-containing protein [Desulforamulus hydrothermalis]|uniref:YetF C-terminal domain-containing protein n=1 Tax=Desulforamulus hydrothermalis Lam5 = DSM 18033 TaxID=1121428 RepID=K8DXM1_9FIRM|nr:DUF421 domain-containing protein [Desulforamulus hydrothermalis]CCO07315.1 conserved membrane hypothetical protein [Desulforamulus hydrothermalis Lam5 = DSM 18033]SHG93855.1 Uncharacterized membrane protein YcaP, DUF421 family [Desulforamulus hydrothermalis Lam5 = DSM 18033]